MGGDLQSLTQRGAPLILVGLPDDAAQVTRYALEIPRLGSLILTHALDGEVRGLTAWPRAERPPALLVFWAFRVMVAIGFAILGLALWGAWRWLRGGFYSSPALLRAAVAMGPAGFVAVLAGWITTEVGRQPWTVYGLLTTAESVAPVRVDAVAASLLAFIVVYFAIFGAGVFYLLRLMRRSPSVTPHIEELGPTRTAGTTPGPAVDREFPSE